MHDSSQCPVCRGAKTAGSMSDQEFFVFVDACRCNIAKRQAEFQERIGSETQWHYDLSNCTLKIGSQIFKITPVGTHSADYQTWLWAWANEDFPVFAREKAKRLQSLHGITGFQVFLDRGLRASTNDAQDFVAIAVHFLGAIGFFRIPTGCPTLFLAVQNPQGSND